MLLFLGNFLCALCASAVQSPIPASHKSLKNPISKQSVIMTSRLDFLFSKAAIRQVDRVSHRGI